MNKINFSWRNVKRLFGVMSAVFLLQTNAEAQCLSSVNQYPFSTVTPTILDGLTHNTIDGCNYEEEYALVNVVAGQPHVFYSSSSSTYITISANGGLTAVAHGVNPLTYTPAASGTVRVYFNTNASCGTAQTCISTSVVVGTPPTCLPPGTGTASNITTTTASLNWAASTSAPAIGYEYYYFTTNTAPTASTTPSGSVGAGVLTAAIGGTTPLTPGTTYYAWVRAVCSATDRSAWTSLGNFTTNCLAFTTPFLEDFTSTTFTPNCWSQAFGVLASPTVFDPPTSQWFRNQFGNASVGTITNGSARINIYGTGRKGWLISPSITLGSTPKQLEFDLALTQYYGSTQGVLGSDQKFAVIISTDNGTTWTAANTLQQWGSTSTISNTGTHVIIDLSTYSGTVKLAFYGEALGTATQDVDLFIDNVQVVPFTTCNAPTNIAASAITNNAATIGWTASTSIASQGYQWEVRSSGAAGSGPTGLAASGTTNSTTFTANATSLSANTTYSIYVRTTCGTSTFSGWSSASVFTTACSPFAAPFYQSFDAGSLPSCWTNTNATNNTSANALWKFSGTPDYGANPNGRTAGTYAWVDASTPFVDSVRLTSPSINLTGLTTPYIKFDIFKNNTDLTVPLLNNLFYIQVNSGTGWNTVYTTSTNSTLWRTEGVALPASYLNATVQIRFCVNKTASNNFYDDILLDSVSVVNAPTCLSPSIPATNVITNITTTSANFAWTAPSPAPAVGYEYYFFTSNTPPTASTTPNGSSTTTSAPLTPLLPNTTYYVWVRSVCSATDKSPWTAGPSFTTQLVVPRPWTEGFTTTTTPPGFDITGWIIGSTRGVTGNPSNNIYKNQYNTATQSGTFSTVNVGTILAGDIFSFDYKYAQYSSPYNAPMANAGYYKVYVSTNFGSTYAQIDSVASPVVNTWLSKTYPLTAYVGQNVKVKIESYWNSTTLEDYDVAFDNLFIGAPPCTPPVVALGNDTAFCAGGSLTLNAGNATASHLWSTAATSQTINVTTSGTYWVAVTSGTCVTRDTIVVTVNPLPVVALGNDTSFCDGGTLTLNAGNAGAAYLWSNAATTQTINVTATGTYNVRVTNTNGCIGRDTIVVTEFAAVTIDLGNDTAICENDAITLDATIATGDTYLWSDASNAATLSVSAAGSYYVVVTDTNGCVGSDTVVISLQPDASGTISVTNGTNPGEFNFSVTNPLNANVIIWSFGDNTAPGVGNNVNKSYAENGDYTVTLALVNICGDTTFVTHTVKVEGLSIGNIKLSEHLLSLYPNPSQSVLNIANKSGLDMIKLTAFNVLGQSVYQANADSKDQHQMNISSFASGVYTLKIETSKGIVVRKFEVLK